MTRVMQILLFDCDVTGIYILSDQRKFMGMN